MTDYLAYGQSLIEAHPYSRTMYGTCKGARVWIKQTCPPKARIWHGLQQVLAVLLQQPIFRCTVSPGGPQALAQEAARLTLFRERGFFVPEVLALNERMLVLSDAGPQLRAWLDTHKDTDARTAALRQATRALAAVHRAGMTHGRPYVRDMTYVQDEAGAHIGFLDLEEDPVRVMPLRSGQARDVWLFLGSAARFARVPENKYHYQPELIGTLWAEYSQHTDPAVLETLEKFVRYLNPLRVMLERPFIWRRIGNDARQSVFITGCIAQSLRVGIPRGE